METEDQSASSSSDKIIARQVRTPCPISDRATTRVTLPSVPTRSHWFGTKRTGAPPAFFWASKGTRITRPAPANALPRAAPADVAGERLVDVGVVRLGLLREQRRRLENHPRLAVTALRDVLLEPGALTRMAAIGRESLDRRVAVFLGLRDGHLTGPDVPSVLEHRARAADADSASVFGPGQRQPVAQHPEKRHVRLGIDLACAAVDRQAVSRHWSPP